MSAIMKKQPDLNMGKIILARLKAAGNSMNQVELSTDKSETNASVLLRSIRVAQTMKKRGIGLGDISVVCGNTHNDISIPMLASVYIGCAFFPLSMTMKKTEIRNMLEVSNPAIIFCDSEIASVFAEAQAEINQNVEIVVFGNDMPEGKFTPFDEFLNSTGTEEEFEASEFDPAETLLFIACSSGTTGLPKGVCHTHKTVGLAFFLMSTVERSSSSNFMKTGTYLSFSTVYWLSGIYNVLMSALVGMTRINCAIPYSVELLEKALVKYKPTAIMISPVAMCEIVKHPRFLEIDWSSVRVFYVGASPVAPEVVQKIQKQVKNGLLLNAYGMSEIGALSINMDNVPNSVGKLYPWIQWRVVDPDTEEILGPNKVGELRLKSECLFHSYLKNPTATAAAYDDDGYYKTGDLVTFDENNYLFIVDRLKELMKFRNYQITPAELEFEIIKLPGVVQVAVVGQKHPEDGDHPLAFVQKLPGSNITTKQIKDCVLEALSDVKQLRGGVVFLPSFPTTPSGKVDRKNLRGLAQLVEGQ